MAQLEAERVADAPARASFFAVDGDDFVPGPACRSPWNPRHQNGVAVAGLLTYGVDRVRPPLPMLAARLTIDILRPTPLGPVKLQTAVVREGRKMQVVESAIVADGVVTARACLFRVRKADCPVLDEPFPYPAVEACAAPEMLPRDAAIAPMVETRGAQGGFDTLGPAAVWARFRADIVPGAPASGLAQTAMLSDFGNGLSSPLRRSEWTYANIDIAVHQVREPQGSWVLVAAETMMQGEGVGLVNTVLGDERGVFGRAHQTLFVERRGDQR